MKIPSKLGRLIIPVSVLLGILLTLGIESVPSLLIRVAMGGLVGLSVGIIAVIQSYDPTTKQILASTGAVLLFLGFISLAIGATNGGAEMIVVGLFSSLAYYFGVRRL